MPEGRKPAERSVWVGYLLPLFVIVIAVLLCVIFLEAIHVSDASASIVRSLIWPCVLAIVILLFRTQVEKLLDVFVLKVDSAEKLTAGATGIVIETGPRQIPIPKNDEPVTLANVALLHTSFIRKDKTAEFSDGLNYYQIEIIVVAPQPTLDRIVYVIYRLDPSYAQNIYEMKDRRSRFKLKELANGTSIVRAEIKFREQDEPLYLNRFIDLRPEGPRI